MRISQKWQNCNVNELQRSTTRTTTIQFLVVVVLMGIIGGGNGEFTETDLGQNGSKISALFLLGDASVDCGDNTLFYPLLHHNLSLLPCNSDSTLIPQLLAEKMGLPYVRPFYSQNGDIKGLSNGLNFGSAQATILNPSSRQTHQSLNQQLRQVYETFQLLQLQLSEENALRLIRSSVFYLSFGKQDYIDLFLHNASGILHKFNGQEFAQILVNQMSNALRNIYDINVRKVICMGILPLGCTPRTIWERGNSIPNDDGGGGTSCVNEINQLILQYNTMLEEKIVSLNTEFPDANFVFCDVYQGMMKMVTYPSIYGFEDVKNACCGLGSYGAMIGCLSADMGCNEDSQHVWWDLYNPTKAVNRFLADSAWFGHSRTANICRPIAIQELVSI